MSPWHLPIESCFVYTENLFSAATFIHHLSWTFWIICCSFHISTCCFTFTFMLWRRTVSFLNLTDQPLPASNFSSADSSPLSAVTELKRVRALFWVGPCSGLGLGLRACHGWFDLLSRPLKLPPYQQSGCSTFLSVCLLD